MARTQTAHYDHPDIRRYFESADRGAATEPEGLREMRFGEYMVEQGALSRAELFEALMFQDLYPEIRIGECASALGFVPELRVAMLVRRYLSSTAVDI
jgi:hypothetical protein